MRFEILKEASEKTVYLELTSVAYGANGTISLYAYTDKQAPYRILEVRADGTICICEGVDKNLGFQTNSDGQVLVCFNKCQAIP